MYEQGIAAAVHPQARLATIKNPAMTWIQSRYNHCGILPNIRCCPEKLPARTLR